jgi:enoyl-CoA hydratase/carnithine racemase
MNDRLSEAVSAQFVAPHVLLVTIDRPEARNAINVAVTQGLDRALELSESDPEVWAVILTGAGGRAFSAGADLKEIAAGNASQLRTDRGGFAGFVNYPREKPWIAAVEGFAVGGGCEVVLSCDMVVAAEASTFALPEVSRGLIAGAGGLYRLPRVLPRNVAFELIATGTPLSAVLAHAHGMVNRLVPNGHAVPAAIELATAICSAAPVAVRESLKVARMSDDLDEIALRTLTKEARERNDRTDDQREGPRAFIEKRAPRWVGK